MAGDDNDGYDYNYNYGGEDDGYDDDGYEIQSPELPQMTKHRSSYQAEFNFKIYTAEDMQKVISRRDK